MFTYRQIKAIEEHRYADAKSQRRREPRLRRSSSLPELLGAIALGLASLGIRDGQGRNRPSSPAY